MAGKEEPPLPKKGDVWVAMQPYKGAAKDELTLEKGDEVKLLKVTDDK